MNEDISNHEKYGDSTVREIFNDILEKAISLSGNNDILNKIYRESNVLRLQGDELRVFLCNKLRNLSMEIRFI